MTTTALTNKAFLRYFTYKLKSGMGLMLVCCALNVLALPFYGFAEIASATEMFSAHTRSDLEMYAKTSVLVGSALLFAIAVIGAVTAFNYYNDKHKTDMLGSLPLSHGQRFLADTLSGYIISVLPVLPAGLIGIGLTAIAQNAAGVTDAARFVAIAVASLFFAYSATYAVTVFVCSLCGTAAISGIASAGVMIALPYTITSAATFFFENITGFDYTDVLNAIRGKLPSPVLVGSEFYDIVGDPLPTELAPALLKERLENGFAAQDPLNIIAYALIFAGLIAAAFFITRGRKAERTGDAFAFKHGNHVALCALILMESAVIAGALIYAEALWRVVIVAAVAAITLIAEGIVLRPGMKAFGKLALSALAAAAVSSGAIILVEFTGAFGLKYKLPDESEVTAAYYGDYEFTDREDISKLLQNHKRLLKDYGGFLATSYGEYYNGVTIKYELKDGSTFVRRYHEYRYGGNDFSLYDLPKDLRDYPRQSAKAFLGEFELQEIRLRGVYGDRDVAYDRLGEFARVFYNDICEHYDAGAKTIGYVSIVSNHRFTTECPIQESYADTIAFLSNDDNMAHTRYPDYDPDNEVCYTFSYYERKYNYFENSIRIEIRRKDLDDPTARELLSLLKEYDREYPPNSSQIIVSSTDYSYVYIDGPSEERAIALLLELAVKKGERPPAPAQNDEYDPDYYPTDIVE